MAEDGLVRQHHRLMDMSLSKLRETEDRGAWYGAIHRAPKELDTTEQQPQLAISEISFYVKLESNQEESNLLLHPTKMKRLKDNCRVGITLFNPTWERYLYTVTRM